MGEQPFSPCASLPALALRVTSLSQSPSLDPSEGDWLGLHTHHPSRKLARQVPGMGAPARSKALGTTPRSEGLLGPVPVHAPYPCPAPAPPMLGLPPPSFLPLTLAAASSGQVGAAASPHSARPPAAVLAPGGPFSPWRRGEAQGCRAPSDGSFKEQPPPPPSQPPPHSQSSLRGGSGDRAGSRDRLEMVAWPEWSGH